MRTKGWVLKITTSRKTLRGDLMTIAVHPTGPDRISDLERIIRHDFAHGSCRYGDYYVVQEDGVPQGSPVSPGLADLFAAWKEDAHLAEIQGRRREVHGRTHLRLRHMDDVLHMKIGACAGGNAEDFGYGDKQCYGGNCVLHPEPGYDWAGMTIHRTAEGIWTSPKDIDAELSKVALPHGQGDTTRARRSAIVTGGLARVLDIATGERMRVCQYLASHCSTLAAHGRDWAALHLLLTRFAERYPSLRHWASTIRDGAHLMTIATSATRGHLVNQSATRLQTVANEIQNLGD